MLRGLSFTAKHIASQLSWQPQSYNSYFHHLHVKCIYEIFDKRVIDAYLLAYDIYTLLRLFCIFKRHKIYILCCEYDDMGEDANALITKFVCWDKRLIFERLTGVDTNYALQLSRELLTLHDIRENWILCAAGFCVLTYT